MALVASVVIGFVYLQGPARWALIAGGVLVEVVEAWVMITWSRRGRPTVGIEALVGRRGVALSDLRPDGQVRIVGERWQARCASGCDRGAEVVVTGHDGLELEVRPAQGA